MKALMWTDKYDSGLFDASTPEKEAAAWLAVFYVFNENDYYAELQERAMDADDVKQKGWYDAALAGDMDAAKKLVQWRAQHSYEYERCRTVNVADPDVFNKAQDLK